MIDLHCHYLPGIDDGAATLEEALALAQASVDNGIRCAIMTPHLHPGRYENTKASIAGQVNSFRAALRKAGIPLRIGFAAEVRLAPETLPLIESGQVPFLGQLDGYHILLLEFPHSHIPPGADKLVQRLLDKKIRPLIAHPERNKDVMRTIDKITPFIEMGCMLQLTAASVANRFGPGAHQRAVQLLQSGAPIVVATDAHNLRARPPMLKEGMEAAAQIVGRTAAADMVHRLPLAIVSSQLSSPQRPAAASSARNPPTAPQPIRPKPLQAEALDNNQIQLTIQRYIDAALPDAIQKALRDKLIPGLEWEFTPTQQENLGASLQRELTNHLQQVLTLDLRNSLINGIIQDARNQAYDEFRSRFRHTLQKSLIDELIGLLKLVDHFEDTSGLVAHLQQASYETY